MTDRIFEARPAVREQVPLLVGLMGPSGGGKTFSALRLAQGIQSVVGGDIVGIDTEARRMLHYADRFKFRHVDFKAPFGSRDYLAAIEQQVKRGAKTIAVDSMSHEHEGRGGLLEFHEREMDRLSRGNDNKREAVNMLAWSAPKQARAALINGLLQLEANFILCFRAKESAKPVRVTDDRGKTKTVVEPQGWMPIAGKDFVYEMTVCCLLPPGANGVPLWRTEYPGERAMTKLPEQFRELFAQERALDEGIGRALAEWARGGVVPAGKPSTPAEPPNVERPKSNYAKLLDRARERRAGTDEEWAEWVAKLNDVQRDALADIEEDLAEIKARRGRPNDDALALPDDDGLLEAAE